MSCVSQARARAGQLLFLRRNDLRVTWTCGDGSFVSVPLFIPADGTCRDGPFVSVPLFMPADGTCGDGSFVSVPLFMPADGTCGDGPFVSVPLFMPAEKHGDRHKRTVPMSPPCLLRWTRFFDLEQVVDPGRKVFSQQSGGSDDDRHFSSGDDDHFALERPVYAFLRGLYRGDLFS